MDGNQLKVVQRALREGGFDSCFGSLFHVVSSACCILTLFLLHSQPSRDWPNANPAEIPPPLRNVTSHRAHSSGFTFLPTLNTVHVKIIRMARLGPEALSLTPVDADIRTDNETNMRFNSGH